MSRVILVSNRVSDLRRAAQAGGVAVALAYVARTRPSLWFGWSGDIKPANEATPQQAGRIVSVAAGAALKAPAQLAAYAAAKAGVIKLTESVADELKGMGITANAVLPGTIDTPQNRAAMPDADVTKWVTPDEVAAVLAFLVSEDAGGVTGAAIPVTGRG